MASVATVQFFFQKVAIYLGSTQLKLLLKMLAKIETLK